MWAGGWGAWEGRASVVYDTPSLPLLEIKTRAMQNSKIMEIHLICIINSASTSPLFLEANLDFLRTQHFLEPARILHTQITNFN